MAMQTLGLASATSFELSPLSGELFVATFASARPTTLTLAVRLKTPQPRSPRVSQARSPDLGFSSDGWLQANIYGWKNSSELRRFVVINAP